MKSQQSGSDDLVSICISSYNHQDYIEECVKSALSQTYKNTEIVVVDDASTDDSYAFIKALAEKHPGKIHCFRNAMNMGVSLTTNSAMEKSHGKYIAFLASDDRMHPTRIERQIRFLKENRTNVAVFTKVRVIDSYGEVNSTLSSVEDLFNQPIRNVRKQLFAGNFLNAPSAMVHADALKTIGGFSPALLYTQDYDAWIKLLNYGEISRLPDVLTDYRVHGKNLSFSHDNPKILKMRLEVVAAMVRAVDLWPIETWLDNAADKNDRNQIADIHLALAAHLVRQDYINFNKPLFATSKAYSLAVKAAEYDSKRGEKLKSSLESWILGHETPAWLESLSSQDIDITDFDADRLEQQNTATTAWTLHDWLDDRAPSVARISALQSLLETRENVGTLGAVVVISPGTSNSDLKHTLDSIRGQHRKFSEIWVLGGSIADELRDADVLIFPGDTPWQQLISNRIDQGDVPDFIWVFNAGDVLLTHATLLFGEHRLRQPDALAWYSDEAALEKGLPTKLILKPDFNHDLLRSYPYIGRNSILSTAAIQAVGGLDTGLGELGLLDMTWRLVEQVGPSVVGHIPEVLYYSPVPLFDWLTRPEVEHAACAMTQAHLRRLGIEAELDTTDQPGVQVIRYPLSSQPLVSIIIPTRDHLSVLRVCIETLMEKTTYSHYELLIVDNGSEAPDAVQFLVQLESMGVDQVRVLRWPHPFNFSAINNFAAKQARGEVLLFLNNDVEIVQADWLERMLGHTLRPEVGAVGARLDYLDGRVDHAGLILGMDNSVGFGFRGQAAGSTGYMSRLTATQTVGAVSASCMMMRREVFEALEGFDEQEFPVYYGDADLCLRAGQAGYLITQASEVRLKHMGGATRLLTEKFGQAARPDTEQADRLYAKWLSKLAKDPAYHPAFGRLSPGFDLSPDASRIQEPLPGRPLPVALVSHEDWHGCGHYRIIHPYRAMEADGRLEGGLKWGNFHFTDVARIQPDSVILQGSWANGEILSQIRRVRETTGAKVVLEFDDYLPNIPTRSVYRKSRSQGLIKQMRRAIEQVDWLVVSTPALAQEYADFHPDIRVALNGLPTPLWGQLSGRRCVGKKMRVGWAGGSSHTGDLAEIRALVKDMEDEVEWVFMGMKPEGVRCEFHPGVDIAVYPEKLATLNLDLAVVPLEMNQFNRCKSNLRLLELGACGVPIICTDIEPYRGDLPVTRVRNRYQDWEKAIREHLMEPDALGHQGDALQAAVRDSWMLEGAFLDQWMAAWLQ